MHFPAAVVFVDERYVSHRGFEFLQAGVAGGIVFHVRHHEAPAAFLRRHFAQDVFHLFNRVREHGIGGEPVLRRRIQIALNRGQCLCEPFADGGLRHHFFRARVAALQHDVARRQVARPEFQHGGHAAALPVEEFRAGRLAVAVVYLRARVLSQICDAAASSTAPFSSSLR